MINSAGSRKRHGIGAASKLTGVEAHTLRYWEDAFGEFLKPSRTKGDQRRYSNDDLQTILLIRKLLHEEGYSIAGAVRFLRRNPKSAAA